MYPDLALVCPLHGHDYVLHRGPEATAEQRIRDRWWDYLLRPARRS
jgi:hypothetical protein